MYAFTKFFRDWVVKPIFSLVVGRAVLAVCHNYQWFPELQLASLIESVPSVFATELALWSLAAVMGSAVWAVLYFLPQRFSLNWPPAKAEPRATTDNEIPMLEAATRAYEQGGLLAEAAGRQGSPEVILTFMCWAMSDRLKIYGRRPPSRTFEEVPIRRSSSHYDFSVENAQIVARERGGPASYIDLYVHAIDLNRALAEIRSIDAGVINVPRTLTAAELAASDDIGRCLEERLLPVLQQRGASDGELVAAADGHLPSLSANLERRGSSETTGLLNELGQHAANAFDTLTSKFAASRRYRSLAQVERDFLEVKKAWWNAFNNTLGAVRELPLNLNRNQIERFVGSALNEWSDANRQAIAWAESFIRQLGER